VFFLHILVLVPKDGL